METLYRKVAFEIEAQDQNRTILIGKNANFIFNPNTRNGEELTDFISGCEEIPDTTAQLKADKEELVSYLEHVLFYVFWNGGNLNLKDKEKIESLIKKHKQ